MAHFVEQHLKENGVDVITSDGIKAFQGKDSKGNVVGSFGRADRGRYDAYAKATKGLDKDLAFKSFGGSGWGKEDQGRYDTALAKRNKAQADAKAKADAIIKGTK